MTSKSLIERLQEFVVRAGKCCTNPAYQCRTCAEYDKLMSDTDKFLNSEKGGLHGQSKEAGESGKEKEDA